MSDTTRKLINILTLLVDDGPINQDEMGGCVYCGGSGRKGMPCQRYGYCTSDYNCHQSDCAWVAGDKLLKELTTQQ